MEWKDVANNSILLAILALLIISAKKIYEKVMEPWHDRAAGKIHGAIPALAPDKPAPVAAPSTAPPPTPLSRYTSDEFFEIFWRWTWLDASDSPIVDIRRRITEPEPYCPLCMVEVDRGGPKVEGERWDRWNCPRCGRDFTMGDPSPIFDGVYPQIEERARNIQQGQDPEYH
jgi:hypothetical protein